MEARVSRRGVSRFDAAGALGFGQTHFGAARLGDKRRTDRLVRTADLLMARPEGTLPDKLKDPADLMGLYRLARHERVTHQAVLAPHVRHTLAEMAAGEAEGVVLVIHDQTTLDFTGRAGLSEQLGPVGDGGGRGYLCHNALAVTPQRRVLGLAAQFLHVCRDVPAGETPRRRREHPQRESRLWKRAVESVGTAPPAPPAPPGPPGRRWVHVADRAADAFEFMDHCLAAGQHFLIRCQHDRCLAGLDHVGPDRVHHKLKGYARGLPGWGRRSVDVAAVPGRGKARRARVEVASGRATLAVPHYPRGEYRGVPLDVWVVHVREVDAPVGVEPLEWILLSDLPVETREQAWERVDWYECRPVVEEFHKALKTGAGVEKLQFEDRSRLEPVIALLSVVAAMLLDLRHLASRPDADRVLATAAGVPRAYVRVLGGWRYGHVRDDLSVREFTLALARLGGHQNRTRDGPPGWLTLWRGWRDLTLMVEGAAAIRRKRCV